MTKYEINKNFAENLEKERYKLGFSQKEMAGALGLSLSAYKRIVSLCTEKIELYVLYRLHKLTSKSAFELLDIPNPYLELINDIKKMSESQLSYIEEVIKFEKNFSEINGDSEDYITVFIPTGNMEDGMIYDSSNLSKENIASYRKKYNSQISFGIKITSNHLHPVYNLGDILLISKRSIRDGDTGIFLNRLNGCIYIRKFYQTKPCRLVPVNDYGETFYVDSEDKNDMDKWIKLGTVITKMR